MEEGKLFADIKFILAQCNDADGIKDTLIEGGAKHINYLSEHVTLVIADSNCPEVEEAIDLFDKPVVSSLWVHLSIKAKKLLPFEAFSPIKSIFHCVNASFSTALSNNDIEVLASTLTFYGGRVSKNVATATHFIVPAIKASDMPDKSIRDQNLKVVAPDWVLESVKQNGLCDEQLYDPSLLLPSPPPTPPPPAPQPVAKNQSGPEISAKEATKGASAQRNTPESTDKQKKTIEPLVSSLPQPQSQPVHHQPSRQLQQQSQLPRLQQPPQPQQQQPHQQPNPQPQQPPHLQQIQQPQQHTLQIQQHQQQTQQKPRQQPPQMVQTVSHTQLPRVRMPSNIIRGAQPRFRPILPSNNNVQMMASVQQSSVMVQDPQQPKKVTIYGQYRKISPYQSNTDPQQTKTPHQQVYTQTQHVSIQQQTGNIVQTGRLPQPSIYHQTRGPYQNSHMPPRGPNQTTMIMPPKQQQPPQMINRFQDPNSHMHQRPYQVCLQQPQPVNPNYPPTNVHRQPIYYNQNPNQQQIRIHQQGPPARHAPCEQISYDNFTTTHHQQDVMISHSPQYPGHQTQQNYVRPHQPHQPPQVQPQTKSQPQPQIQPQQAQSQSQTQIPVQAQHQVQGQPQIQIQNPTQIQVLASPNQVLSPHTQIQSQPKSQPQPHFQHQVQPKTKPDSLPELEVQPQPQVQTQPKLHLQIQPKLEPQLQLQAQSKQQIHPQPQQNITQLPSHSQTPVQISQNQPSVMQPNQQFQSNFSIANPNAQVIRSTRIMPGTQPESTTNSVRIHTPSQIVTPRGKSPLLQSNNQPRPHPSIFDGKQESNFAQIKAKVPIVFETSKYYGHDPKENVPKDLPFIGCKFKFLEYDDIKSATKERWISAIKLAGGTIQEKLEGATHLICETQLNPVYAQALKLGVRCITIYWINDVLASNSLFHPCKSLHLPISFSKGDKPLESQIISITNFKGKERREAKEMIFKAGARVTDYFSPSNTLLICGNVGGEKYERAVEWKVPIANVHLIGDILLWSKRDLQSLLTQTKYQLFTPTNPFRLNSYMDLKELMEPWTKPILLSTQSCQMNGGIQGPKLNNEDSGVVTSGSNSSDLDGMKERLNTNLAVPIKNGQSLAQEPSEDHQDNVAISSSGTIENVDETASKVPKKEVFESNLETDLSLVKENRALAKSQEEAKPDQNDQSKVIVESPKSTTTRSDCGENNPNISCVTFRKSNEPIRLLFTHLDLELSEILKRYASDLNLDFANSPINCTHLVVDQISRTPKFICAFSHANYILSHRWIIESHQAKKILDERAYILKDTEGEEKYSFNLLYSLLKRKRRSKPLFLNIVFFVTPSVISDVKDLKEMIESAGGVIATRKLPTKLQVDQLKADGKRLIAVTCKQDYHLCLMLESYGVDIVSVEFVISGILRQDIDPEAHSMKTTHALFIRPETTSLTQISQASPPKKLRINESS